LIGEDAGEGEKKREREREEKKGDVAQKRDLVRPIASFPLFFSSSFSFSLSPPVSTKNTPPTRYSRVYVGVLMACSASSSLVARSTRSQAEGLAEAAASATAAVAAVGALPSGGGRGGDGEKRVFFGELLPLSSCLSSSCAAGTGKPAEKKRDEAKEGVVKVEEEEEEDVLRAAARPIVVVVGGICLIIIIIVDAPPLLSLTRSLWSPVFASTEKERPRDVIVSV